MSYPKFAVDEDVLIYSKGLGVSGAEGIVASRRCGMFESKSDGSAYYGWGYIVEPFGLIMIKEELLRKRPADKSFKELMETLKTPVPA